MKNLCVPLTVGCPTVKNIAFDGCAYYCTTDTCEICKLNTCLEVVKRYCITTKYDCICYDYCEHCFWVSSKSCHNKIFKLDCSMNVIGCIDLCGTWVRGEVTGISYNCCNNSLIISYAYAVIEVDKECGHGNVIYSNAKGIITGVLSLCPYILVTVLCKNEQFVQIVDFCGQILKCCRIDDEGLLINLIYNPCKTRCGKMRIEGLVLKKRCLTFLCREIISCHELEFEPCYCNDKICCECCCEEHHCEKNTSCSDIIESVALMGAALSHILNAEGEKLQKVLAETNDIDKILCVNREINKTIVSATHLEHVLYAKLSAVSELCGEDPCFDSCVVPKPCTDGAFGCHLCGHDF